MDEISIARHHVAVARGSLVGASAANRHIAQVRALLESADDLLFKLTHEHGYGLDSSGNPLPPQPRRAQQQAGPSRPVVPGCEVLGPPQGNVDRLFRDPRPGGNDSLSPGGLAQSFNFEPGVYSTPTRAPPRDPASQGVQPSPPAPPLGQIQRPHTPPPGQYQSPRTPPSVVQNPRPLTPPRQNQRQPTPPPPLGQIQSPRTAPSVGQNPRPLTPPARQNQDQNLVCPPPAQGQNQDQNQVCPPQVQPQLPAGPAQINGGEAGFSRPVAPGIAPIGRPQRNFNRFRRDPREGYDSKDMERMQYIDDVGNRGSAEVCQPEVQPRILPTVNNTTPPRGRNINLRPPSPQQYRSLSPLGNQPHIEYQPEVEYQVQWPVRFQGDQLQGGGCAPLGQPQIINAPPPPPVQNQSPHIPPPPVQYQSPRTPPSVGQNLRPLTPPRQNQRQPTPPGQDLRDHIFSPRPGGSQLQGGAGCAPRALFQRGNTFPAPAQRQLIRSQTVPSPGQPQVPIMRPTSPLPQLFQRSITPPARPPSPGQAANQTPPMFRGSPICPPNQRRGTRRLVRAPAVDLSFEGDVSDQPRVTTRRLVRAPAVDLSFEGDVSDLEDDPLCSTNNNQDNPAVIQFGNPSNPNNLLSPASQLPLFDCPYCGHQMRALVTVTAQPRSGTPPNAGDLGVKFEFENADQVEGHEDKILCPRCRQVIDVVAHYRVDHGSTGTPNYRFNITLQQEGMPRLPPPPST